MREDGRPCHWCGRPMRTGSQFLMPTRDHVVARSLDAGAGRPDNVVWACSACNQVKGNMTVSEWDDTRRLVPGWWALAGMAAPRGRELYAQLVALGIIPPPDDWVFTGYRLRTHQERRLLGQLARAAQISGMV